MTINLCSYCICWIWFLQEILYGALSAYIIACAAIRTYILSDALRDDLQWRYYSDDSCWYHVHHNVHYLYWLTGEFSGAATGYFVFGQFGGSNEWRFLVCYATLYSYYIEFVISALWQIYGNEGNVAYLSSRAKKYFSEAQISRTPRTLCSALNISSKGLLPLEEINQTPLSCLIRIIFIIFENDFPDWERHHVRACFALRVYRLSCTWVFRIKHKVSMHSMLKHYRQIIIIFFLHHAFTIHPCSLTWQRLLWERYPAHPHWSSLRLIYLSDITSWRTLFLHIRCSGLLICFGRSWWLCKRLIFYRCVFF